MRTLRSRQPPGPQRFSSVLYVARAWNQWTLASLVTSFILPKSLPDTIEQRWTLASRTREGSQTRAD